MKQNKSAIINNTIFAIILILYIISICSNNRTCTMVGLCMTFAYAFIILILNIIKTCKHTDSLKIKVKYHNPRIDKIKKISVGDWIDLRAAETVELKRGEFKIISLGVGMILPEGYEAHIVPRSSTYKHFKVLQTNSCGIIDNSYSGEKDIWGFPALAMEDTVIKENERICQFRIVKKMPEVEFEEVGHLNEKSRGGFGSTGIK